MVAFIVADRKEILVALDWTEFDKDGHATIALYLVTSHGRATPLAWKTVETSTLARTDPPLLARRGPPIGAWMDE